MNGAKRTPWSLWMVACVLISLLALFYTSDSPFVPIIAGAFIASFILPTRMERDSANIWGLRLLVYAGLAIFSRPNSGGGYFSDAQAFTSAGLIAGGEIVLQSWRATPRDTRFDGMIVTLSAVVFLVACNTLRYDQWYVIWLISPFYMASALLALRDLRPHPGRLQPITAVRQYGLILLAVTVGSSLHGWLLANRGSIMALGARLLTERRFPQRAGIGDTSTLRSGPFNPSKSTSRIAHIEGKLQDPHLRAAAFDEYTRGTWGPPLSSRPVKAALEAETNALIRGPFVAITLLRETEGQVFFPLNSLGLVPGAGSSFDWSAYAGPVKVEEPAPYTYYVLESNSPLDPEEIPKQQGPLCVKPNAEQRKQLLVLPVGMESGVRDLALKITHGMTSPAEKTAAITKYLLTNYKYSLNFVRTEGDPIADFLLRKKAAHCQYFASAAVMLLRYSGVPARYASGYYVHEEDERPATWVVRTRDAHAWAEAYVDGVGWQMVEATPPDGRADPNANPIPFYQLWWEHAQDRFARVRAWMGRLTQVQIAGMICLILTVWGLERWRQAHKRARRKPEGPVPPEQLAPLASRFERVLAKHGIRLVADRPWSETIPDEWEEGREFIELYNRLRFNSIDVAELEELRSVLATAEKSAPPAAGPRD